MDLPFFDYILFSACCLSVGFLGGVFGIGGGTFLVPLLVLFFGFPMEVAMSLSLMCVLATGLSGILFQQGEEKAQALRKAFIYEPAAICAVIVATPCSYLINPRVSLLLFAGFLLLVSFVSYQKNTLTLLGHEQKHRWGIFASTVMGASSGLLGVGGGVLIIPMLRVFVGASFSEAITISLFIMVSTSAIALSIHWLVGSVLWGMGFLGALSVVPGTLLGSRFRARTRSKYLNQWFFLLAVVTALLLIYRATSGDM